MPMQWVGLLGSALGVVAAGIMLWGLTVGQWRLSESWLERVAWAMFFAGASLVLIHGLSQWM